MPNTTAAARSGADDASHTVLVIDDNELFRDSMDTLFRSVGLKTALFSSAQEFLDASLPDTTSCIVVDVRMPRMSGLDLQAELVSRHVRIPIIVMTGHADVPMTVQAMKAGAVDFLAKPFRDQDIIDAVTAALGKDSQRRQLEAEALSFRHRFDGLTPREKQVMVLVAQGLMNKQVAGELGLQPMTIKLHRLSVMRKMGAKSLADLVRMAVALELSEA